MERFGCLRRLGVVNIKVETPQQLRPTDFETFYRSRWDEVYRTLAITLRDSDLAAEAVDEAMVRAYERWRKVRGAANPPGWVYRVAYNWAIDQIRKRKRQPAKGITHAATSELPVPQPDLGRALDALDIDHRAVVVLRLVHDWTLKDVADALGIPVGTAKSRLSRALDKLRKELNQ